MKIKLGTIYALFIGVFLAFSNLIAQTSDNFYNDTSPKSFWRFFDPVGDVTLNMSGTNAEIEIPSGTSHDLWTGANNDAPRLLQSVSNTDFSVEVKFESVPGTQYQLQGIIVQETDSKYLRMGTYSSNSGRLVFAAFIDGSSQTIFTNTSIGSDIAYFIRVERTGNDWNYSYSTDGTNYTTAASFTQVLTATEVGFYGGNAGGNPAFTASADYFWNLADTGFEDTDVPGVTPPVINVWFGDTQTFGNLGNPQEFVNVLGNVSDANGVASISYKLNGGSSVSLPFGPDGKRLLNDGDFNIELPTSSLLNGANTVEITATDALGAPSSKSITLNYQAGNVWSLPYTVDFTSLTNIENLNSVANAVDGNWELVTDGIRNKNAGYDRLLVAGDKTWSSNMEVEVPITIHSSSSSSGVGFALGWQGHTGSANPRLDWPLEAIGWVRNAHNNPTLEILRYNSIQEANQSISFSLGTTYILKVRSEEIDQNNSRFQVKIWEDGTAEPANFMLSADVPTRSGSVLMITHRSEVTWGNMTITPLTANQAPSFTSSPVTNAQVGQQYTYNVTASDPDVADNLSITEVTIPGWLTLNDNGNGTAILSGTPTNSDIGLNAVELKVEDDDNSSGSQSFNISVAGTGGASLKSDHFCVDGSLNNFWRIFDPYDTTPALDPGETPITVVNSELKFELEAGVDHNLWAGALNLAPRILQSVTDTDMEFEARYLSVPSERYQMQGFVVHEDNDTFIRLEVFHDGTNVVLFAAFIDGNTPTTKINTIISNVPEYLKVTRVGDNWTFGYSDDGTNYTNVNFTQALTVTEVGIHGGNTGSTPPAFDAVVDYFWNTAEAFPTCDAPTETSINIGSGSTFGGSTITVPIDLTVVDNFHIDYMLQAKLHYDPAKLAFKFGDYGTGTLLNDFGWTGVFYVATPGTVEILLSGQTPIDHSGTLFNLAFQVTELTSGAANLTGTDSEWVVDLNETPFIVDDGLITYSDAPSTSENRGDVTLDFNVNIFDALDLLYHVVGLSTLEGQALINADVNIDSKIDLNDYLTLIFYIYLHDWDYEFPPVPDIAFVSIEDIINNNDTYEIPITINEAGNTYAVEVDFDFDPNLFDFVGFFSDLDQNNAYINGFEYEDGKLKFVIVYPEIIVGELQIGSVTFKKKDDIDFTESVINTSYSFNKGEMKEGESVTLRGTEITDVNGVNELPEEFKLFQNYPNPFNPGTSIKYQVTSTENVLLVVYNILGKEIKTLVNESQSAGIYNVDFDASNLPSGVYFYKLSAGNNVTTKKMLLIK